MPQPPRTEPGSHHIFPTKPARSGAASKGIAPSGAIVVLNRLGFGPRPGDVAAFNALGGNDSDRLQTWLAAQLDPGSIDDSELNGHLANPAFMTQDKTLMQLWQEHVLPEDLDWSDRVRPLVELQYVKFLRAAFSRRQLFEVLADFWNDHFSVHAWHDPLWGTMVHYDRDVIRPNMLGNFRDMALATAQANTMLFYLDNAYNSQYGPNENYAREFIELHTLGAKNYLGHMASEDVPLDGQGRRIGYVENDVKEFARSLTGWSIDGAYWDDPDNSTGEFFFRDDEHDPDPKQVLGVIDTWAAGDPLADCITAIDRLCEHPGTAGFVAEKLCRRLISDNPPANVVQDAADVFHQNWQAADQLKQVVETIVLAPEFLATWGEKAKRPFERMAATMRAFDNDFAINPDDEHSQWFYWNFIQTGNESFGWHAPNGYPDRAALWLGSTALMMTWKMQQFLHDIEDDSYSFYWYDLLGQTMAGIPDTNDHTPNNLAAWWYERIYGYAPSPVDQQRLAEFMSYTDFENPVPGDLNAPVDLTLEDDWPAYTQARLRAMIGMMVMSPEFVQK